MAAKSSKQSKIKIQIKLKTLIYKIVRYGLAGTTLFFIGSIIGKNFGFDKDCSTPENEIFVLARESAKLSKETVDLEETIKTLDKPANEWMTICSSLARQKKIISQEKTDNAKGTIEGNLLFRSDEIPYDLQVCARDLKTDELYCTNHHIESEKYEYGWEYKLQVPQGRYYVYSEHYGYRDYHKRIVEVKSGKTTTGITPHGNYSKF